MKRYVLASELITFATKALVAAGLEAAKARIVAETLVEGDLLGHSTHGLQLLPVYLTEIESGLMTTSGEPETINDSGSAFTWDGNFLPGPWLLNQCIEQALIRSESQPVVTAVIRKSHHIACLQAYLKRVTDRGLMIILSCSDPANKTVAPFGATTPLYSPNPIAVGVPTESDPILIDVSTSATANGRVKQAFDSGQNLPHAWLLDAEGEATDDPATFFSSPASTILPLGGLDTGYKGFALAIMIEALTNALGGFGRAESPSRWLASVFVQIINPRFFGGNNAFKLETQYFKDQAERASQHVRIPGARALAHKEECLKRGINVEGKLGEIISKVSKSLDIAL